MNPNWPDSQTFWKDKTAIVTGGSGFLGRWVVEKLQEREAARIIVPRSQDYDLRDLTAIRRFFADIADMPNKIVIHLAGRVGGIGANRTHPAEFFYDNLMMSVQFFHESWRSGVDKFVAIGTICAYPKFTPVPFKEENLWNGYPEETNAPYGLAKKMLLVQSQTYRRQYGFNSIFLLPVNLYGPGDNFDPKTSHVIPALIRKFSEAQSSGSHSVTLWGTGQPSREFLYVKDAAAGILLAAERYDDSEPVNLGSGMEISISALADRIAKLLDFKGEIVWDSTQPDGQPRRCLDTNRAEKQFGFKATTPFDAGLQETIQWYQSQLSPSA